MTLFNQVTSAIFDVLLAPFGHGYPAFDMIVWPVLAGVIALLVYKRVSNQKGIARAKDLIQVHLLEVVLWRDDLVGVLVGTGKALLQNAVYVGHNILPMLVMLLPMSTVLVQIVSNYAYAPLEADEPFLVEVALHDTPGVTTKELKLELPPGVVLDAPPVRTPDGNAAWRLRAAAGDHVLTFKAGSEVQTKGVAVGGEHRKVPVMRTATWESFLYPGEPALSGDSAFETIKIGYPSRSLVVFPDGEGGILIWFFVFSLVAGFLLKDYFGVTL